MNINTNSVYEERRKGKSIQLIVNQEYAKLVPPLSNEEFNNLKESIKINGQLVPIIINTKNIVLDGHHRIRACKELKITPQFTVTPAIKFPSPLHEKLFVIENAISRRHLNAFSRIELALSLKPILTEIAKKNSLSNLSSNLSSVRNQTVEKNEKIIRVDKQIGDRANTSSDTVWKVEKILKKATPNIIIECRRGTKSIHEGFKIIQIEEKRQQLIQSSSEINNNDQINENCKLFLADYINQSKTLQSKNIPDNSVDLILTDPVFENNDDYLKLGHLSQRVLRDGGSLIVYVPTHNLPKITNLILESGLNYHWLICIRYTGRHNQMFQKKVMIKYQPILWFCKGKKIMEGLKSMNDFIESKPPTNNIHKWEKSEIETEYIISHLSVKNQTIFDPFFGSCVSGEVALKLGRKFIGIENNKDSFKLAQKRLSKYN